MTFQKAVKRQAKLKVAISGPSGSGKTYSALLIASEMGKKIAVIDTENGSASLYADKFTFDTAEIAPPFTPDKFLTALNDAIVAGYDVVVMDSISHEWAGSGGLLDQKEMLDASGKGNSYTNWASITKKHETFKEAIVQADVHIIATMRSKQDYILQENQKGKQAPIKVGMAPVQRDGMEYEFTLTLDLSMNHSATVSKDRTSLFDGKVFVPTVETGKQLVDWLNGCTVADRPAPVHVPVTPDGANVLKFTDAEKQLLGKLPPAVISAFKSKGFKMQGSVELCRVNEWNNERIAKALGVLPADPAEEDIPFGETAKPAAPVVPAVPDAGDPTGISGMTEREASIVDFESTIKDAQEHHLNFLAKQVEASAILLPTDRERLLGQIEFHRKALMKKGAA